MPSGQGYRSNAFHELKRKLIFRNGMVARQDGMLAASRSVLSSEEVYCGRSRRTKQRMSAWFGGVQLLTLPRWLGAKLRVNGQAGILPIKYRQRSISLIQEACPWNLRTLNRPKVSELCISSTLKCSCSQCLVSCLCISITRRLKCTCRSGHRKSAHTLRRQALHNWGRVFYSKCAFECPPAA